jgi:hypothetical protein
METLRRQAVRETHECRRLSNGEEVSIGALVIHFPLHFRSTAPNAGGGNMME